VLKMFYGPAAAGQSQAGNDNYGGNRESSGPALSREQAADILGVEIDASEEDIVAAHRRLIQRVHPDRGGSDALAAQINDAKRVMLGE
jgi:DnaJ family protein C protein 19